MFFLTEGYDVTRFRIRGYALPAVVCPWTVRSLVFQFFQFFKFFSFFSFSVFQFFSFSLFSFQFSFFLFGNGGHTIE